MSHNKRVENTSLQLTCDVKDLLTILICKWRFGGICKICIKNFYGPIGTVPRKEWPNLNAV